MNGDFAPVRLAQEATFSIGRLRVMPALRSVATRDGTDRTIEPRVMQALVLLRRHEGRVVSRDQLIAACWDGRVVGDDAINSCIAKVRRIGESYEAFSIETVPRVGYSLLTVEASAAEHRNPGLSSKLIASALIAAVVLAIGAWWLRGTGQSAVRYEDAPGFMVAPFRSSGDDSATQALARALPDEIAASMGGNFLRVATRSAAEAVPQRLPNASFSVGGTVSSSGRTLHVLVVLEKAVDGAVIWSQEFSRPGSESQALRREISTRVANVATIAASLGSSTSETIGTETLSMVIDSYDRYFFIDQRNIEDIVALLERVTRNAPNFGPGHAMYGNMLLASSLDLSEDEFNTLREAARAELRRASELAPDEPAVYVGLAALTQGTEWSEREASLREGLSQTEGNATLSLVYGRFLMTAGFLRNGLSQQRRAAGQERFGQGPMWWIASSLYGNGDVAGALTWLDDFIAAQPNHVNARRERFLITALSRPPSDARALMVRGDERPLDLDRTLQNMFAAYLDALEAGTPATQQAAVDAIMSEWPDYLPGSAGIRLLSRLGRLDAAFELADAYVNDPRTMRESYHFVPMFLFGPDTEAMRRDPRFVMLVARLGLLDYWRSTNHWPDFCRTEPESVCATMMR